MRSMTGFGEGLAENERFRVQTTLRSVNHRQLDINLRIRDPARKSEQALRELIRASLSRGRVDVSLEIETLVSPEASVDLREDLLSELGQVVARLEEQSWVSQGVRSGELLRVPELLEVKSAPATWQPEDEEVLLAAAQQALDQLTEMREIEGAQLLASVNRSVAQIRESADRLAERREVVAEGAHDALRARIEALANETVVDPVRLAQEAAILVEKADIQEELERLASHLDQVETTVGSQETIGRRLDFLSQELLRELNTIGAKSRDQEMIQMALDARLQCEQLREQIQNVE